LRRVEIGLFDVDVLPVDVELFGDQHWQHVLDALAKLGIFCHDGDGSVGGDLNIVDRCWRNLRLSAAALGEEILLRIESKYDGAARREADFQEEAATRLLWSFDGFH